MVKGKEMKSKEPSMPMTKKQKKFYEKMGWSTEWVTKRMAIKRMADLFEQKRKNRKGVE